MFHNLLRLFGKNEREPTHAIVLPSLCDESWIALDFETATRKRNSACAVGIAFGRKAELIGKISRLIKPPENQFDTLNTSIHGINAKKVKNAHTFSELWPKLKPTFQDRMVLAHNAAFDMSVLRHSLDAHDLPYPQIKYFCTVEFSRAIWPDLKDRKLKTVAKHLGINFKHHDAEEDAFVCARVAIECMKYIGVHSVKGLGKELGIKPKNL